MTTPPDPAPEERAFCPPKPVVIGLVGGVASGKSTVAKLFSEHGIRHVDADHHARAAASEPDAIAAVARSFGPEFVRDGGLDRARLADRIFRTGLHLLEREMDGTRFRLIGIGVSDLSSPEQADPADLVDPLAGRRAVAEGAIDKVRAKFGKAALETGYTFGRGRETPPQRDRED